MWTQELETQALVNLPLPDSLDTGSQHALGQPETSMLARNGRGLVMTIENRAAHHNTPSQLADRFGGTVAETGVHSVKGRQRYPVVREMGRSSGMGTVHRSLL